ncbi:hypothetical protein SEVIR_7G198650v4 [Setaria viridis]
MSCLARVPPLSGSPSRPVDPLHFLSKASRPALSRLARHERRRRRTWRGRCGTSAWPERPSRRRRQAQAVPPRVAEVTHGMDPITGEGRRRRPGPLNDERVWHLQRRITLDRGVSWRFSPAK